jgi:guanyl-specific ribonuclease Sa
MLKNRNLWLKVVAVLALSLPSVSLFAGTPEIKANAALTELLAGSSFQNYVQLPAVADLQVPEAALEKAAALSPQPGKDFSPKVEDQARIKAIMKLLTDIYQGNHLPYAQDGVTFKNKEGKLPAQPAGFYKEYTLLTGSAPHTVVIGGTSYQVAPDLSARGSERVIIGGGEKIYYTPDHYAHFIQLTVVY